jgi:hypothetical protein
MVAKAGVRVVGRRHPAFDVGLATDELEVAGALAVTVAGTVLGASLVRGVLGGTTVGVHGHEVEGTIQAARKIRHVNVERELVSEQSEHCRDSLVSSTGGCCRGGLVFTLVLSVGLHQVETRTNVGRVLALGDELEVQLAAAGGYTVGAGVVGAVDTASGGASIVGAADGSVPSVTGVAVGGARDLVSPTPVGIDCDGTVDSGARATGTALGP